jgi:hypothetical protein
MTWLAWYISGVLVLMALAALAITFHPSARWLRAVLVITPGIAAPLFVGFAVFLGRMPTVHWIHQSRSVRWALVAIAIVVTLIFVFGVVG